MENIEHFLHDRIKVVPQILVRLTESRTREVNMGSMVLEKDFLFNQLTVLLHLADKERFTFCLIVFICRFIEALSHQRV